MHAFQETLSGKKEAPTIRRPSTMPDMTHPLYVPYTAVQPVSLAGK